MRRLQHRVVRGQRGQALVEFAIASLVFFMTIFGTLQFGLMIWHYRFTGEEISAATGLSAGEIDAAAKRFGITPESRPKRAAGAPLLVLPYPGGRHPRIG